MLNLSRLLNTEMGRIFISLLLGLGLATMFRKVCADGSCLEFNGPVIDEMDGKTYKFGEYCYKYQLVPSKCDPMKKTVRVNDAQAKTITKQEEKESKSFFGF